MPNTIIGGIYAGSLGWIDYTSDVRQESASSGGGIEITRGITSQGSLADHGRCSFVLNNRHGKYSPRNPRSPYFGLIGRNTPVRFSLALYNDSFNRTVSGGMGTADSGQVWAPLAPASWSVSAGKAVAQFAAVGNTLTAPLNSSETVDSEQVVDFTIPAVMTGATLVAGVLARFNPAGDSYYWLRTEFDVAGVVRVKVSKVVGGAFTELGTASTGLTYSAGTTLRMRAATVDSRLTVKVWPAASPEPKDCQLSRTDTSITQAGRVGLRHWLVAGNTNVPVPSVSASNYSVVLPRFTGEVSEWPSRWDLSGRNVWVPVEASGILRRLNQGTKALRSPIFRNLSRYNPTSYLPLEDGTDSTAPTNAVAGGRPGVVTEVNFSSDDSLPGASTSVKLEFTASALSMRCGTAAGQTAWSFLFYFKMDSLPGASFNDLLVLKSSGKVTDWSFGVNNAGFRWIGLDNTGATIASQTATYGTPVTPTAWVAMELLLKQNGSNVEWTAIWHDIGDTTFRTFVGQPFSYAGNIGYPVSARFSTATLPPTALAHVAAFPIELPMLEDSFRNSSNGFIGEAAGNRIARLTAEEGLSVDAIGDFSTTELMGKQKLDAFLNLIYSGANADGGILFERRNDLALAYVTRQSLYNQIPLALSYSAGQISQPFEPTEDADDIRNDVTVTREGGASARYVKSTGPLSTGDVGTYDDAVTLNLTADDQASGQASWRVWLGTVDEARWPRVRVNLMHPVWSANRLLTLQAAAVDTGDVVSIDGLPDWLPPGPIKLLVMGYTETLDANTWEITWNAKPASPWDVAVMDGPQRVAADGATLASAASSSAMSLSLATTSPETLWTTNPADFPLDLLIGGERITVSAISGTSSPQTATVSARAVNGIVKAHTAGTPVDVYQPAVVAL